MMSAPPELVASTLAVAVRARDGLVMRSAGPQPARTTPINPPVMNLILVVIGTSGGVTAARPSSQPTTTSDTTPREGPQGRWAEPISAGAKRGATRGTVQMGRIGSPSHGAERGIRLGPAQHGSHRMSGRRALRRLTMNAGESADASSEHHA